MAKHPHIVIDFEEGEVFGLALPADAGVTPGDEARIREDLTSLINGITNVFSVSQYIDRTTIGKYEWLYYNGQLLREGISNDYLVTESGGMGTGYDTVVTEIVPLVGDTLEIIYIPV